ncbi:MATE family efflux transporter [Ancylobacter sp. 6x-1]|uniref:MATE family efflux transporter n=1 Tax=Ancylobacter crimeensis TaxID=2579147 RepID=A0ABT0D7X8_9HYPH|nr:MATE family efflux transporter [Ancylobacter crimeensis]MCK0196047.1 MATE family efflux transporter [Ancylobacter crimeensis]
MSTTATAGYAVVTHRRFLSIALPATLAEMTTPILGLIATGSIGRLGDAVLLGAVAIGALLFDFVFWVFGAVRLSTAGLTAQALGRTDQVEMRAVLARALLVAATIGTAIILVHVPIATLAFRSMGPSPAVTEAATLYFGIRILSTPFAIANFALLGWLIGLARTDIGLALQILIAGVNAVATALLVLHFDLGIAGAASASVLAEACGTLAGLIAARRLMVRVTGGWRTPWRLLLDRRRMIETVAINSNMIVRTGLLMSVLLFFTSQGARQSDAVLAANAVLLNVAMVTAFFLDGFSTAAEQVCGQSVGSRDRTGFTRAVRMVLGWGFGFALPGTLLLMLGGGAVVDLLTSNAEVRVLARDYLPLAALTPLAGAAAFAYDGIYGGATWSRDMRNLMLPAVLTFALIWWLTLPLGNVGLWIAYLGFLAARGLYQALRMPTLERRTFG